MNGPSCRPTVDEALARADAEAYSTADVDVLAAEVRTLREQIEQLSGMNATLTGENVRARTEVAQMTNEREGWRSVAESLRARDEAAQRVIEAIVRTGPSVSYHYGQILRLAQGWRPLAQALAGLCTAYDQPVPRAWRSR